MKGHSGQVEKGNRRFIMAGKTARTVASLLGKKHGARKVVLIGSLMDKSRFHAHSDIDLGVEGISDDRFYQAAGEALVCGGTFDIDLIPLDNADKRLRSKAAGGNVLYEALPC